MSAGEVRVPIFQTNLGPHALKIYRMFRKAGLSRHDTNMVIFGYATARNSFAAAMTSVVDDLFGEAKAGLEQRGGAWEMNKPAGLEEQHP